MADNTGDAGLLGGRTLIAQCAESKVYECDFYSVPAICKHRFEKKYRHPRLDKKLREQRTVREARALALCRQGGVRAPVVYSVDKGTCSIVMEKIPGSTVKDVLDAELAAIKEQKGGTSSTVAEDTPSTRVRQLLTVMGEIVGKLHNVNVIHGDLTTSNFMSLPPPADQATHTAAELVVIDFGLVSNKNSAEERAVDLYVLERAITSTHPFVESYASQIILAGYATTIERKKGVETMARLAVVRARGRKRSMVG